MIDKKFKIWLGGDFFDMCLFFVEKFEYFGVVIDVDWIVGEYQVLVWMCQFDFENFVDDGGWVVGYYYDVVGEQYSFVDIVGNYDGSGFGYFVDFY